MKRRRPDDVCHHPDCRHLRSEHKPYPKRVEWCMVDGCPCMYFWTERDAAGPVMVKVSSKEDDDGMG